MISHIPHATRVFIGLTIITLMLIYLAITLSSMQERGFLDESNYLRHQTVSFQQEPHKLLVTTGWVEYRDLNYPLVFSHPPDWEIETGDHSDGFYNISLTPADSEAPINFYIGRKGYLGFDGLKTRAVPEGPTTVKMQVINDNLFGIKRGDYYYTFDGSMSTAYDDEFFTIMQTVRFE